MRDIQKEIQENLTEIETTYQVKILLAVESGSRAWGFASPDSDYDVRFIYMHNREEYLRIDPIKDVIEWQLDEWDWLKETVFHYFSEKSALCHYYGTANSTLQGYLTGDLIRYKKYFYALRPLLCCRWIERYHEAPPMEFHELLRLFDGTEDDLNESLYTAIQELLSQKVKTEEKDLHPQMPVIIEFLTMECARQKQIANTAPDDHKHDFSEINRAFRKILGT